MPAAKVEPEPPPAAPAGDLKVPRAPLLKRLMEIESTIANIKAPDNLDGYKTLDLHTAARRGDMRAVAALVPNHMASMRLRDEAGWMPIHHATCAGRRCVFRVPCHTTKMVDLHEREKVADDVVNLLEAATQKVEDDEHNAEIDGTGPVDISFSEKMARALDGYLPHAHAPGLGPVGAPLPPAGAGAGGAGAGADAAKPPASPGRRGKKAQLPPIAEPAAAARPSANTGGDAARAVDAMAMKHLRDEKPVGLWLEVKWLPPPKEGQGVDAMGPVPPANPHPNAAAEGPGGAAKAYVEIMLLELHDSEYDGHVPRATNTGRILPDCALDVAMVAISRALSIWEPDSDALEELFQMPEEFDASDHTAVLKKSLLSRTLAPIATRSVLRISGISVDGEKLFSTTGGGWKDFMVRANLVTRNEDLQSWSWEDGREDEPGPLKVETGITAKTSTRPKPSALDWGSEALTLEIPGPAQLPLMVQLLVRAKDGVNSGAILGHALVVLDNINGQVSVQLRDANLDALPASPPPSPPSYSPGCSRPPSPPPYPPPYSPPPYSPPPSPPPSGVGRPGGPGTLLALPPPAEFAAHFAPIGGRYGHGHGHLPTPPPSPPPSPPGDGRPMTAPGPDGGGGLGPDGRPMTAGPTAAGGGEKSAPLQPLSAAQANELLRQEIEYHKDRIATQGASAAPTASAINIRFNYMVTVPYAALAPAHTAWRHEKIDPTGGAAAGAAGAAATTPAAGAAGDAPAAAESGGSSSGGAGKGALGSFVRAAVYDGPACLRELLKAGSDPDSPDLVHASPLHKATANGDTRALRLLLGAGANIDHPNMFGDTCMHRAIENSRLATVTELLKHGADVDKPNRQGNTPLHLACATGHEKLVRALLSAGALALVYNLRGYVPLHTAIASGQKKILDILMKYHEGRRLPWATLLVAKTNDTPLHVAVRALRVADMMWMVNQAGFSGGLVMKNNEARDPLKLLKEAKKLLSALNKFKKKKEKALKKGGAVPEKPAKIVFPPQNLPLPDGDPRERMAKQLPGQTEPYLLDEPCYVNFHTTPLPPPEPKGKKKKGGKKEKKAKVVPPPVFTLGIDEALLRLDGKGGAFIDEALKEMAKKYEEEKKIAEKLAAERKKMEEQKAKDAKAKEAKGGKKK
jgi:ankyrin repeat protein